LTNKIIDRYKGEINISERFRISKFTTKEQLISFFGKENISINDMENGYTHYYIKNIDIGDSSFNFILIFNHEQLHSIIFGFDYSPDDNWDNWSQEKELKRLDKYNNWLTQQIGTKRKYPWGEIGAFFNPKGGSTSITLRYIYI
jgi:hypothetical protein